MAGKRKRPNKAAASLLTEAGYLNAMADLFERLSSGELTRDETSALIGARRCLQSFADAREAQVAKDQHAELVAELKATQDALKHKGSGATSFTRDSLSLPRRDSTASDTH